VHNRVTLTGTSFFPRLISSPFRSGLHEAFAFAILACLIAAAASLMRGGKYHYTAPDAIDSTGDDAASGNGLRLSTQERGPSIPADADLVPSRQASTSDHIPTREEQHAS
jgi:hypothetical protein